MGFIHSGKERGNLMKEPAEGAGLVFPTITRPGPGPYISSYALKNEEREEAFGR